MNSGDLVREFAKRMGWPIAACNVIVEGLSDALYLHRAAELHRHATGEWLLDGLAIFPTGDGEEGGTYGIQNHFPGFRTIINLDLDASGRPLFRVIALLDCDPKGKQAFRALTAAHTKLVECRDVFLLRRKMECGPNAKAIVQATEKANAAWSSLDCVIEDLLPKELVEFLAEQDPRIKPLSVVEVEGKCHYHFRSDQKPILARAVVEYASAADLTEYVAVLNALRRYLGLSQ